MPTTAVVVPPLDGATTPPTTGVPTSAPELDLLLTVLPAAEGDEAGLGEQAAMALAAQSPLQLTAALGVPVTAVTRQPDVFVTVVPPQPEDKSWVYILVGVLGTLVAVLAVGFVLYRRKMQRKKRGDAPHITTAYKQTHRHDDRSGLTRGDDLPDLPEYEEPGLTKEQQWLQDERRKIAKMTKQKTMQYGTVGFA